MLPVLSLLLAFSAYAKDPCKGVRTFPDAITGQTEARAAVVGPAIPVGTVMVFVSDQDGTRAQLSFQQQTAVDGWPAVGEEVQIRAGDAVLVLPNSTFTPPKMEIGASGNITTTMTYTLVLEPNQLEQLAAHPVSVIRYGATDHVRDWGPSTKRATKIQSIAECFLSLT